MQHPVYYLGRAIKDPEARYSPLEKVVFTLITTMRRLMPYFQAHLVQVLTDQPLASVYTSLASSSRMVKWAVELMQYVLEYMPHSTIKAQVLTDFIIECTTRSVEADQTNLAGGKELWELHLDDTTSS